MQSDPSQSEIFSRVRLLLGDDFMRRAAGTRVIVFGVGGVGSWCAESLVRTGIGHLTIVDCDRVAPSNINRQLMATVDTVGQIKVDALRAHLLTVNPAADIRALCQVYNEDTAPAFDLDGYDYVIDAIDSLKDKMLLIDNATSSHTRFFSSMGAALKLDPTRIRVDEFRKVTGCPLARALRQRFKRRGTWPRRKFTCVYSPELIPNACAEYTDDPLETTPLINKPHPNGSLIHITSIFGNILAGLVIEDITKC